MSCGSRAGWRRTIRQGKFETRYNTAFAQVIRACAETPRQHEDGHLDHAGDAAGLHPAARARPRPLHGELARRRLVGGIYGVRVGRCFCGESMFHRETDASKVALAALAQRLQAEGVDLIDCQVRSEHLISLGAREIPRRQVSALLEVGAHGTVHESARAETKPECLAFASSREPIPGEKLPASCRIFLARDSKPKGIV